MSDLFFRLAALGLNEDPSDYVSRMEKKISNAKDRYSTLTDAERYHLGQAEELVALVKHNARIKEKMD